MMNENRENRNTLKALAQKHKEQKTQESTCRIMKNTAPEYRNCVMFHNQLRKGKKNAGGKTNITAELVALHQRTFKKEETDTPHVNPITPITAKLCKYHQRRSNFSNTRKAMKMKERRNAAIFTKL